MSGQCGSTIGLTEERCKNLGKFVHEKHGFCVHHEKLYLMDKLSYSAALHLWVPEARTASRTASRTAAEK
jgi:hypothetical protein